MNQEPLLSAFTRLRDNLLSMSRHILQNEDDASDAIQEAFCRLWPIRNKIKSEKEAAALTVTTTRNICIDQIRKKARFPELDIETNNECDEDNSEKENLLERFQTVKLLIEKRLTENQRKILELRDYQGLEIEDIANRLNMQPATIRMNLSRARKTIREHDKNIKHGKRNSDYWDRLIERYYSGNTTIDEEKELSRFVFSESQNKRYDEIRAVLSYSLIGNSIKGKIQSRQRVALKMIARIAACIAIILSINILYFHSPRDICVTYIYGKKYTDTETVIEQMKHTVSQFDPTDITVEKELSSIFRPLENLQ